MTKTVIMLSLYLPNPVLITQILRIQILRISKQPTNQQITACGYVNTLAWAPHSAYQLVENRSKKQAFLLKCRVVSVFDQYNQNKVFEVKSLLYRLGIHIFIAVVFR